MTKSFFQIISCCLIAFAVGLLGSGCEIPWYAYYYRAERLNVSLLIDRSGSMGIDTRMEDAKAAAVLLLQRLDDSDVISVVAFQSFAEVVVPAQPASDSRKPIIEAAIEGIITAGGTSVSSGLAMAYPELDVYRAPFYWNILILICDGDVDLINSRTLVTRARQRGIYTSTIGLAVSEDQMNTLRELADLGGGSAIRIHDGDDVDAAVRQVIDLLLSPGN